MLEAGTTEPAPVSAAGFVEPALEDGPDLTAGSVVHVLCCVGCASVSTSTEEIVVLLLGWLITLWALGFVLFWGTALN